VEPHIRAIYRYPVKGLSGERLSSVELSVGKALPFDRAFAIENGPGKFDPLEPRHLPKTTFLCLMRNEQLAQLETAFDADSQTLTIKREGAVVASGALSTAEGRQAIEAYMAEFMAADLRGAPRVVSALDHSFSDVAEKCLHIVSANSLRGLEAEMGIALDALRFRPNVIVEGIPAWAELGWVDREIRLGGATLRVFKRTVRCAATDVNPQTAARDARVPDALFGLLGHRDFGIYASVIKPGAFHEGDALVE
jgi:uncharacterized protein